ncbi:hypothetical protein Ddye_009155 [Dipteronia dyeriana]|uniref:Uncharacterized protein n=1 Tax=Dipteronia dyeriana TaxID=168575 RepID=A0AAD9XB35_9ROSI|nr:hypothetical protein Ddye_009155 [Dipteronia dyeriana]
MIRETKDQQGGRDQRLGGDRRREVGAVVGVISLFLRFTQIHSRQRFCSTSIKSAQTLSQGGSGFEEAFPGFGRQRELGFDS